MAAGPLQTASLSAGELIPVYSSDQMQPAATLMAPVGVGKAANTLVFTPVGAAASGGMGQPGASMQGGYAGTPGPTNIATSATVGAGAGPVAVQLQGSGSVDIGGGTLLGIPQPLALMLILGLVAYLLWWKVFFR
jgi:hypothetical protein